MGKLLLEIERYGEEFERFKSEKEEQERRISELTFLVENKSIEMSRMHERHEEKEHEFREVELRVESELRINKERVQDLKTKLEVSHQQIQIKENEY